MKANIHLKFGKDFEFENNVPIFCCLTEALLFQQQQQHTLQINGKRRADLKHRLKTTQAQHPHNSSSNVVETRAVSWQE